MTDSPSDAPAPGGNGEQDGEAAADLLDDFTAGLARTVGSERWTADLGTPKVYVDPVRWVEAITSARDSGLDFLSWISAVDWSRDVAVGEPVENADEVEERFEVLACLSTTSGADFAVVSTSIPKDQPAIDSLVDIFGGAEWHEREAHEMFGIDFRGNPKLVKLYLPDAFEGYPLRKDYALLSREVKPWPGTVDVEGMPSDETEDGNGDSGEGSDE